LSNVGSKRKAVDASFSGFWRLELDAADAKTAFDEWASNCAAAYYRNGIYISFRSGTQHEEAIAAAVVHEIAHALWERLAAKPLTWRPKADQLDKYRLFVEGFATYAEIVWFLDLHPEAVRRGVKHHGRNPNSLYYRGLRQVEEVVRHYGTAVLPQIPKRWQEL
jgi:hypothetical protein